MAEQFRPTVLDEWSLEHVAPGTKLKTIVRVTTGPDGLPLGFPLLAARARSAGPTLCAVAGVHGDEFEGGEALRSLWNELDPETMRGAFVGIPVANMGAFEGKHRVSFFDYEPQDMGRVFSVPERTYLTGMVARKVFEEVASKSDAVVDLHSAGMLLSITPCAIFYEGGSTTSTVTSRELANATGLPILRRAKAHPRGALAEVASHEGIPGISTETGGEGRCHNDSVALAGRILKNIAARLGIVQGDADTPAPRLVVEMQFVFCKPGGLFRSLVELERQVHAGQKIGVITDVFGDEAEVIRAPTDGVVVLQRTYPGVFPGDLLFGLGRVI